MVADVSWHSLVAWAWLAYIVVLSATIILEKRDPAATLSWIFGLAAFPIVGLVVYYFLGPRRIRRHRIKRARYLGRTMRPDEFETRDAAELSRLAQRITGLPMTTARSVELLIDGSRKYHSLLAEVRTAREQIHLEYYIYEPDHIGAALREALIERARAGVTVRLLVDAIGSVRAGRFLRQLQDAGGQVAWFHPARLAAPLKMSWANLRTHRKIVVIDHHIGYTGGINITDAEDDSRRADAYRDLHLRLEGAVVRELQQAFVEDWAYATGDDAFLEAAGTVKPPATAHGAISAQVVTAGPDNGWEPIHRVHVSAIHAAHERAWLMTPYFVPSQAALMALTSAALSGVDVRVMVPRRSDSLLVTLAARSYFDELLQAGVKIYEYGPRMLHTKALLVDDNLVTIGTANFDNRSFRLNFEVAVLFDDRELARQMNDLFLHELDSAPQVQTRKKLPLLRARIPEAFARLMSPLL